LPAIGAETGRKLSLNTKGQPTSATPYAEFAGSMFSPAARGIMAGKPTEDHAHHVEYLLSQGITPTAGQQAGVGFAPWLEDFAAKLPFVGGLAKRVNEKADRQLTELQMSRAGVEAPAAGARTTPMLVGDQTKKLGNTYNEIYSRNNLNHD